MAFFRRLIACVLLVAAAAPVAAAEIATDELRLDVIPPFSIGKMTDLDFGHLTVRGAGRVIIDPTDQTRRVTGGVVAAGSSFSLATFLARGDPGGRVRVTLPQKRVNLVGPGGTTLQIRQIRHDVRGRNQRLDAEGYLTFHVGGTLDIPANAQQGHYTATFDVEVTYQ